MCGIAGIHYKQGVDVDRLERVAGHFGTSLRHRGPDAFGAHRTERAVYVNLRLAIVDRSGGDQPMYEPDGKRGIVYNGEVYNWQALRQALAGNYPFSTHCDTEAVLASVLERGNAGLAALNGMFGLCIWDDRDGSFLLARDRFGAKPLYVYEDGQCIAFASELRTLLGVEGLDHTLDPVGFQDLLSYRYNLAPHTMFARIRKLPAGCVLRFDGRTSRIERFAEIELHEPAESRPEADYLAELDALMQDAVRSQLMGEVPIGVLLSGGLDSSAIAAYVHRAGARLKAYSIGFPEVNEFEFSRDVARRFDLDYVEVTMTQGELRDGMDDVIAHLDEPMADPACFALSRLCRRIREDVTVVLSGEGGDELFAGYGHHQLALHPGLDRDTLFAHFFFQSANFIDANQWLRDKTLPQHHLRLRTHYDRADTPLNGMQCLELHSWMPENLMMKADKVLMAHSLEGRFPFLDLDLWRFASTLPQSMKLPHAGSSKHVLRRLMSTQLPRSVIERRKMGFTVPPAFFLKTMQSRLLAAVDTLRGHQVGQVLDLDAIAGLIRSHYAGDSGIPVFKIWNIAVMLLWWTEVYPGLRPASIPDGPPASEPDGDTPRPEGPCKGMAAGPTAGAGRRRRLLVYTVLVGAKEALANPLEQLPAGATTDLDLEWVCITDNPALRSPVWRMQLIPSGHVPPEKLSRRPKAMPHEYFPDADFSLYVDNTVSFKRLPQASDLETSRPYLFRAFRHSTRNSPYEEASAVATLGYDDVNVICQQIDFYEGRRPMSSITPLTTCTVLLREHHPAVKRFGVLWWESLLAFSKRDQLSFDFALQESGAEVEYFAGHSHDNSFIHWQGSLSPNRVRASFDSKRYAWLHRNDELARRDPKSHFLARGGISDEPYQRDPMLLEYACHATRSSLGNQVSPRRAMATVLEPLLMSRRVARCRYLLVRVHNGAGPRAFDAQELDAAARALSMYMNPAQGALIDLDTQDMEANGQAYGLVDSPYDLLIVIGASGEQLGGAVQKLHRLLAPEAGLFLALLSAPARVRDTAQAEMVLEHVLDKSVHSSLQASRHDDLRTLQSNTVVGFEWQPATLPQGITT
jgi:asparagine synthase (glutamine-hydrolysing)